ncbi:rhodanese-like domain-containing protein [Streptomyces iakyrus]|uniref:rhodanese-like domain-containing protein n=1 Tax=Streptomyces iakyrus TaxID=68219 RepID=UPI0033B120FE
MFLPQDSPGRITPARAHRVLEEGTAVLVDVRETDEYRAGHVPGSVHVPLSRLAAGADVPGRQDGHSLMLICRSGHRSKQAAGLLGECGVAAVDVVGGMRAWAADGLAVQDPHGAAGTVI